MPGQKGESGKKPSTGRSEGAYAHSDNTMGGAETPHMQGWNSYGAEPIRGGAITSKNSGGGGGNSKKGGGY